MKMIKCDGCGFITPDDSSGERVNEVWVNQEWSFHICKRCMMVLHQDVLHEKWNEDNEEWEKNK